MTRHFHFLARHRARGNPRSPLIEPDSSKLDIRLSILRALYEGAGLAAQTQHAKFIVTTAN